MSAMCVVVLCLFKTTIQVAILVDSNILSGQVITDSIKLLSTKYFLIAFSCILSVDSTPQGKRNTAFSSIICIPDSINA